jgi:hypothetical protein
MTVQAVTAIIGAVGGLGGLGALVASVLGRRKLKAEAADVITDTALTLVEPLQRRVRELEAEAEQARRKWREFADGMADALALIRRWRIAMRSQRVDREELRIMADEQIDAEKTGVA